MTSLSRTHWLLIAQCPISAHLMFERNQPINARINDVIRSARQPHAFRTIVLYYNNTLRYSIFQCSTVSLHFSVSKLTLGVPKLVGSLPFLDGSGNLPISENFSVEWIILSELKSDEGFRMQNEIKYSLMPVLSFLPTRNGAKKINVLKSPTLILEPKPQISIVFLIPTKNSAGFSSSSPFLYELQAIVQNIGYSKIQRMKMNRLQLRTVARASRQQQIQYQILTVAVNGSEISYTGSANLGDLCRSDKFVINATIGTNEIAFIDTVEFFK